MTDWNSTMSEAVGAARANGAPRQEPDIWHDGVTARQLDGMEFAPIKWIVPGFIAEGCTLLAGRPKLGKSWLVLDAGLAVAAGGESLGQRCEQGDVLYLALEDNRRRLQARLRRIWPSGTPMPDRLRLMTTWPQGGEGGAAIRRWIKTTPGARLVIVDVLAIFKAASRGKGEPQYEVDYAAIRHLQAIASATGVGIVVVHHTRKSGAEEDPFEKVSGTLGLSGAADTTIILDRDGQGCTLYGRGRDVTEFEVAVTFDKASCRWQALGEAAEVRRSDERTTILAALADAGEPLSPKEIADLADMPYQNTRQTLSRMAKAGEVEKAGRGKYVHPFSPPGHNGHKVTTGTEGVPLCDLVTDVTGGLQQTYSSEQIARAINGAKAAFEAADDPSRPEAWA